MAGCTDGPTSLAPVLHPCWRIAVTAAQVARMLLMLERRLLTRSEGKNCSQ